jgi:hypothetical protein
MTVSTDLLTPRDTGVGSGVVVDASHYRHESLSWTTWPVTGSNPLHD